jgi:hypothetical protein
MRLALAAALLVCALALSHASRAAEERDHPRAKDAAEAVQEGNVANWLKYYTREREQSRAPDPPPAERPPAPASAPPPRPAERR